MGSRERRAVPRFGRRRRRGRTALVLLLVVVLVAGGVGLALTGWPGTDRGEALVADPTTPPPAEDPTTGSGTATPSDPTPTSSGTPSATADDAPTPDALTATAAMLSEPPTVDVAPVLADPRPEVGRAGERLQGRVEAVIAELAPSLAGTDLAVAVRDADGRRIVDHASDRRLLPASTMKTVTAATVLSTLGGDHRFETRVEARGEITDGVLRGDLLLRGGGDPVLTSEDYRRHVYPSRPATSLEELADAVAATGLRTVTGELVGDGGGWGNAPVAAGWRSAYLDDQNARHVTPLTVDAGLTVKVEIPDDAPVQVELHGAPDPVRTATETFAALLAERGIAVRGGPTTTRLSPAPADPVASISSPPVSELLTFTVQRSDNHLADMLLLAAGHHATGSGSWAAAERTAAAVLDGLGVPANGLRVTDGSGLSRLDRLSAAQLADVDAAMTAGPHRDLWVSTLAVAGESGTLRGRLRGTPAEGRFAGKTGTLDDVKAVVGHVTPLDGDRGPLHLAVMSNGTPAGGQWAVTVLMDRLALELADHLDGCRTTRDEEDQPTRTCGDG